MRNWIILIFISLSGFAKMEAQTATQFNSWWANVNSYTITDKFFLKSEIHIRRSDFVSHWQQFLIRPTAYFKLNDNIHIGAGYSFLDNFPYGEQPIATRATEHQAFEDLVFHQKINQLKLLHRYRLEQRWMGNIVFDNENHPEVEGTNYGNRFRYRFGVSFPLFHTNSDRPFYFTGYDEVFLTLNKNLSVANLNQNWIVLAIGHQVNNRLKVEAGYRNQRIRKGDNSHVENNHALDFAVKYAFDFRV